MARPKLEDRPTIQTERAVGRPKRIPIHGEHNKLTIEPQEAGYHYIWVNDDKVGKYERAGYEFVTHDCTIGDTHVNHATSMATGRVTIPMGNGVIGVAMRCANEIYQAELDAIHTKVDELEKGMHKGLQSKTDGRYGKVTQDSELVKGEPTTKY